MSDAAKTRITGITLALGGTSIPIAALTMTEPPDLTDRSWIFHRAEVKGRRKKSRAERKKARGR